MLLWCALIIQQISEYHLVVRRCEHSPQCRSAVRLSQLVSDIKANKKAFHLTTEGFLSIWQGRRDSNSQHPVLETGALPIELRP